MPEEKKPMFDGTIVTLIDEDGKELVLSTSTPLSSTESPMSP
jgi:hypothetical protein